MGLSKEFSNEIQEKLEELYQAFVIGLNLTEREEACIVFGDNLFYGSVLDS